ncbi:hypothetical protein MTR_1g038510 [Medicago truncatula]|uniref:Uncharacterized protein n=1 Tax=Medicago truncatula TaxID=3880 RepID=G7IBD9_MEDTR|nr:hypothetical protein MTR_1g038510 [Medicago truncatula]
MKISHNSKTSLEDQSCWEQKSNLSGIFIGCVRVSDIFVDVEKLKRILRSEGLKLEYTRRTTAVSELQLGSGGTDRYEKIWCTSIQRPHNSKASLEDLYILCVFAIESVYGRVRVVSLWADSETKIDEAIEACPVNYIS